MIRHNRYKLKTISKRRKFSIRVVYIVGMGRDGEKEEGWSTVFLLFLEVAIHVLSLLTSLFYAYLVYQEWKAAKAFKSTVILFGSLRLLVRTLSHMRRTGLVSHSLTLFTLMRPCINVGGWALPLDAFHPLWTPSPRQLLARLTDLDNSKLSAPKI